MPYTPDPTVGTEPTDSQPASSMGLELRLLKSYIQTVLVGLGTGKLSLTGGTMTGPLLMQAAGALTYLELKRSTQAAKASLIQFLTADTGIAWQIVNPNDSPELRMYHSGSGLNTLRLFMSGDVIAARDLVATRDVYATKFYGDGSSLTGIAGGGSVTGPQVVTALGYTPYNAANPAGYISSVTGSLGYTPYNASNPAGYITGISGTMVVTALGYVPPNGSNLSSNSQGVKTISTLDPSGVPANGDIWYKYTP